MWEQPRHESHPHGSGRAVHGWLPLIRAVPMLLNALALQVNRMIECYLRAGLTA